MKTVAENAAIFHSYHDPHHPLALGNVWDVASAVIAETAGAQAIATTSAGVAWCRGRPDGNQLSRAEALAGIGAIAGAVEVPVTADIEGGYASSAKGVAETVKGVLDAGVVGINIEDGDRRPNELVDRIHAARATADDAGVRLFINARTDVFLAAIGVPEQRLDEALARAGRYVEAGADGIFVPGAVDAETIAALSTELTVPLNVLVGPGAPSVAELGKLGAARVSLGSAVAQAAYATVRRATAELLGSGTYRTTTDGMDFGELNGLLINSTTR